MSNSKARILDAAENLFGVYGLAATSLRAITRAAGVNAAAIHYHFHSKSNLIRAVYTRRLGPINERSLAMLDQCEARHGVGHLPLEEVLRAFLTPLLEFEGSSVRLISRMYTELSGVLPAILLEQRRPLQRSRECSQ